ncbi:MAG: SAM-dependent DNA methyltransferase [Chthoniobacterales bacterium]
MSECNAALNGGPSRALRQLVSLKTRRKIGSFFSSFELAGKAVDEACLVKAGLLYDPSCGGGDLLLAAARQLRVRRGLCETVRWWGTRIGGRDVHPEFVRTTKARLLLLARKRTSDEAPLEQDLAEAAFPRIEIGDGPDAASGVANVRSLLVNPPFHLINAPKRCTWATGRVNAAAVFLERLLVSAATGTRLTAILPEVLRTGARYERWRQSIGCLLEIHGIDSYGLFDNATDVHVFVLRGTVIKRQSLVATTWWKVRAHRTQTVSDCFDVHVGPVVPHRDANKGPLVGYIHARSVPRWTRTFIATETRRFQGTLFQPPFVVIRRTSRPEDRYRAVGSVVTGPTQIAVENHLIVCIPKDGTIRGCVKLIKGLKTSAANEFVNERMRCRHLTVGAVCELPLPTDRD